MNEETKEEKYEKARSIFNFIKSDPKTANSKFVLFLQRLINNIIDPNDKKE